MNKIDKYSNLKKKKKRFIDNLATSFIDHPNRYSKIIVLTSPHYLSNPFQEIV